MTQRRWEDAERGWVRRRTPTRADREMGRNRLIDRRHRGYYERTEEKGRKLREDCGEMVGHWKRTQEGRGAGEGCGWRRPSRSRGR
jgi:hypothetical protein